MVIPEMEGEHEELKPKSQCLQSLSSFQTRPYSLLCPLSHHQRFLSQTYFRSTTHPHHFTQLNARRIKHIAEREGGSRMLADMQGTELSIGPSKS
jgi:hypothetical protein